MNADYSIKNILTILLCLVVHVIAIGLTSLTLFFSNDIITLTFMIFLVFLVFIQTLLFGCIINKIEQNAVIGKLIDIAKYLFKIKTSKKDLLDDIPIMAVGLTLAALCSKLFIILILGGSETNIKLLDLATRKILFFQFYDTFIILKNLLNNII